MSRPTPSDFTLSAATTVKVGPASISFNIHKSLLCASSPFFAKALTGDFKEAHENTISLPTDDVAIFRLFVDWLYSRSVPKPDRARHAIEAKESVVQLTAQDRKRKATADAQPRASPAVVGKPAVRVMDLWRLLVFAEGKDVRDLPLAIGELFTTLFHRPLDLPDDQLLEMKSALPDYIYGCTMDKSIARKKLVDVWPRMFDVASVFGEAVEGQYPERFLLDLLVSYGQSSSSFKVFD